MASSLPSGSSMHKSLEEKTEKFSTISEWNYSWYFDEVQGPQEIDQLSGSVIQLDCGHTVVRDNGLDDSSKMICQKRCQRIRTTCRHPCSKKCGEECGPCMCFAAVLRPCGRHYEFMKCYQKSIPLPLDMVCYDMYRPMRTRQTCGHDGVRVYCCEARTMTTDEVNYRCQESCEATLYGDNGTCGHPCSGTCGECFQNRIHKRCQFPCGKTLICNHICKSTCGSGCPPCELTCLRSCLHKKCDKTCGKMCDWECNEECSYSCDHGRCTQRCDEICDKKPCIYPCAAMLGCGHACVGFCGELCPPYCRICDPEKLAAGAILTLGEVETTDTFVYLEECKHAVESRAMDQWMSQESEDGEILPKCCPICHTRLRWIPRYSAIMHSNWQMIESVKERTFGNEKEINGTLLQVDVMLQGALCQSDDPCVDRIFCPDYLKRVENLLKSKCGGKMYLDKANFLEWAMHQWLLASKRSRKFVGFDLDDDLRLMTTRWETLFHFVAKRDWPLQKAELAEFYMEKQRLEDYTTLYSLLILACERNKKTFTSLFFGDTGQKLFLSIQNLLGVQRQYVQHVQEEFRRQFLKFNTHINVTLDLTGVEREEIINAFGGRTGRWFKCRNGHVYVITECGGAMEHGVCPVCKTGIGGVQHRLLADNSLAPEMDGANQPLYTALIQEHEQMMREHGGD